MRTIATTLQTTLSDKRISPIAGLLIATDRLDYPGVDQVFPLYAEQQFFLDELRRDKLQGARALEIGLGSGVLSIAAAHEGAMHVTALEINPRAKNFAGFNILLNQVEAKISILDGNKQIYAPVKDCLFDYIICNPPFEPTPPDTQYFYHSDAGIYGLDFLDALFQGLDTHLTENGHAQIVTGVPGNAHEPSLLLKLIEDRLSGAAEVIVSPVVMTFDAVMDRMAAAQKAARAQVDVLRARAAQDGVTHMYLCVIHYEKGRKQLQVTRSARTYDPCLPLSGDELA